MYHYIISDEAEAEIKHISEWYKSIDVNITKNFLKRLRNKIHLIIEYPEINSILYKNVHAAKLDGFPYSVHYTINKRQKQINIIGVFHTAANPENWKR